jgi:beta-lactamase regulating signal transducer with metallopeptidase domain
MDFFDTAIAANTSDSLMTSVNQQQTEVAPTRKMSEMISSLTVCDYLGGFAIMLIFLAITRMISQASSQRKSKKCSDVELLERIWKMDASKINH